MTDADKKLAGVEEIWDKYSETIGEDIDTVYFYAGKTIMRRSEFMKAIQEFAEQYHQARMREELIKFMEFQLSCSTQTTLLTDEKFVDEYLKQRNK